jgi:hypothetical protein
MRQQRGENREEEQTAKSLYLGDGVRGHQGVNLKQAAIRKWRLNNAPRMPQRASRLQLILKLTTNEKKHKMRER